MDLAISKSFGEVQVINCTSFMMWTKLADFQARSQQLFSEETSCYILIIEQLLYIKYFIPKNKFRKWQLQTAYQKNVKSTTNS